MLESHDMIDRVREIFDILDHAIPDADTELEYNGSDYSLLVAVVLSAQSTDRQVNIATANLFPIASTPDQIIALGYDGLCQYINSVGLYKTKAKNLIALSNILVDKFDGKVPRNKEDLMSLPGIGLKSANVLLNILNKMPTIAVDTHVFRVATRLGLSDMKTRDRMSEDLEELLPLHITDDMMLKAHHLLVLHGRYTCKARRPLCNSCPIAHLCNSKDKNVN